jgi:hypothetical protein
LFTYERFKSSDPTFEKCIIGNNDSNAGNVFILALQVDAKDIGLYKCSICGIPMDSEGLVEFHEKWNHSGYDSSLFLNNKRSISLLDG